MEACTVEGSGHPLPTTEQTEKPADITASPAEAADHVNQLLATQERANLHEKMEAAETAFAKAFKNVMETWYQADTKVLADCTDGELEQLCDKIEHDLHWKNRVPHYSLFHILYFFVTPIVTGLLDNFYHLSSSGHSDWMVPVIFLSFPVWGTVTFLWITLLGGSEKLDLLSPYFGSREKLCKYGLELPYRKIRDTFDPKREAMSTQESASMPRMLARAQLVHAIRSAEKDIRKTLPGILQEVYHLEPGRCAELTDQELAELVKRIAFERKENSKEMRRLCKATDFLQENGSPIPCTSVRAALYGRV